jgi:2-hydroxy-3-keto-5-methylthiopentenyl-1-phosphate phosphatase
MDEYTDGMNKYNMDTEYNYAKQRLHPYDHRIEFVRKISMDAITMFEDNSIDVIYIDGNHEYTHVLEELTHYWKKLKVGGILIGDDVYELAQGNEKNVIKIWDSARNIQSSNSFGVYGVYNALIDFCKEINVPYTIFSNQFIVFKH